MVGWSRNLSCRDSNANYGIFRLKGVLIYSKFVDEIGDPQADALQEINKYADVGPSLATCRE